MAARERSVGLAAGAVLIALVAVGTSAEKAPTAHSFARRTIYHSPQTPGYTCWVGAWIMPDQSLMVTFKQATGPLTGRPRSMELLQKMGLGNLEAGRDFTGLKLANVYLRSTDGGETWTTTGQEEFPGPFDRAAWGGSHCALGAKGILRAIDGSQLPLVEGLPRRIFFQHSADWGATWTQLVVPPQPARPVEDYLGDFGDCISRVRRVKSGNLVASGVIRTDAKNRRRGEPLLMFSADEGRKWQAQKIELTEAERQEGVWNEWDWAEVAEGRMLCVFRRTDPADRKVQVRWQGILAKRGDVWALENYRPAPFPHSGHPELLATREGPILHLATTEAHWTTNAGETWNALESDPPTAAPYRSRYYPRSLQTADGRIYVFSHVGADDAYGARDQSIVMDTFQLRHDQPSLSRP